MFLLNAGTGRMAGARILTGADILCAITFKRPGVEWSGRLESIWCAKLYLHSPKYFRGVYTERIVEGKPAGFRGRKANLYVCG
jgi:hypothetical protein